MTVGPPGAAGSPDGPATFERHRALLFTIAYGITGSVADAEDVVQETWLRFADALGGKVVGDGLQHIRSVKAYLARITTRLALNAVRSRERRRETYVGPWLPEPLLTTADVADDVVLADAVSTAVLVVLDTLPPVERAVFVLREVFAFDHAEIARAVDRTETAVRQIAHRAREHVRARRPERTATGTHAGSREVLERFFAAALTGDLQALMDVLAPDVVLLTDGGGIRQAALRPIVGAAKVSRFLQGVVGKLDPATPMQHRIADVAGGLGLVIDIDGETDTVATLDVEGGRVVGLYLVRNPEKLGTLTVRAVARQER